MPQNVNCISCGQPTTEGRCVNVNCERGAKQASAFAGRSTAKQTAGVVSGSPSAWSSSGGVD